MADEDIIKLAEKTIEEKYCEKYNNGSVLCSDKCKECPMYDEECDCCHSYIYNIAFLDGFKAALNEICKDVDKHVCTITFQDTGKDD